MNCAADFRPDPQAKRDSYLRIERVGRPAAPWLWKIYLADDFFMRQSRLGYRCAEDALKVGEVFLRRAQARMSFASS
jgi:hypothetical protein